MSDAPRPKRRSAQRPAGKKRHIGPPRISKRGRVNEGRPPLLTGEQFRKGAAAYFEFCRNRLQTIVDEDGEASTIVVPEPYTIEGLCLFIGKLLDRPVYEQRLDEWENGEKQGANDPELAEAVKAAKLEIRADCMRRVNEARQPTGSIFYAKAALGYRDVQTVESSGPNGQPAETVLRVKYGNEK